MHIFFILLIIKFSDESDTGSRNSSHIGCKTLLDHGIEKTKMECRTGEVMYVERQVLISGHPSIEGVFKTCYDVSEKGGCTMTLPQNETLGRRNLFPIGNICNLRVNCVLDASLLKIPVVLNDSDCSSRVFKSTSFTYTCIQKKHIYSLKEDTSFLERTSDVYLVTDSFGGNFNCDVAGPLRYLHLLELKEATLHVSRDGQQLYKNDNRDIYGEDIGFCVNNSNCTTCVYSLNISSASQGRVWLHLKGDDIIVNCTRIPSSIHPLVTTERTMKMTLSNDDVPYTKGSNSRLFVLLVSGLVLALVLMAGLYAMQRRNYLKKLNNSDQQNDIRISSVFSVHVTDAAENANIYSEISHIRRN